MLCFGKHPNEVICLFLPEHREVNEHGVRAKPGRTNGALSTKYTLGILCVPERNMQIALFYSRHYLIKVFPAYLPLSLDPIDKVREPGALVFGV